MVELSPAGARPRPAGGLELYAWLFMRVSGILLVLLALGHLAIMHLYYGVENIDFSLVAERWANPLWRLPASYLRAARLASGANTAI